MLLSFLMWRCNGENVTFEGIVLAASGLFRQVWKEWFGRRQVFTPMASGNTPSLGRLGTMRRKPILESTQGISAIRL